MAVSVFVRARPVCISILQAGSSIVGAADYPKISDADWSIQIFF